MRDAIPIILPQWPAPANVCAVQTTRSGGFSSPPYAELNLAQHVGDQPEAVRRNRALLHTYLQLEQEPCWLEQTHSTRVVNLDQDTNRDADAALTAMPGKVAAVMTADCLPVLLCATDGSEVAAAHAGWRGLANGILEQTVTTMCTPVHRIIVWLGPAIGPTHFEVGEEVQTAFVQDLAASASAFTPTRPGHYLANLYRLARLRLNRLGIDTIYGGNHCTYSDSSRFFSYRRDKICGRQASLIYIKE